MKKLFSILGAILLISGSFTGAILQSGAVGALVYAATDSETSSLVSFGLVLTYSVLSPRSEHGYLRMAFTEGLCEAVQSSLIEIHGAKAPSLSRTQTGYLDALQSAQNNAGITKVPVDNGTGKKKQVRIKFIKRGVEDDIVEVDNTKTCATDLEKEPFEDTVEITKFIGTKGMKFDEEEMRKLCEADSAYMGGVIRAMINPLVTKLNKALITLQSANFGDFYDNDNDAQTVQLLQGDNEAPRYLGEHQIKEDFADLEVNEKPMVIGAGNLSKYASQVAIGCCNGDGVDLSRGGDLMYFRDKAVESILGANHFIGLVPGMVQLLTWNKYVGTYRKENDKFSKGTFVDPVTGLTFDMKWQYDECLEIYSVRFFLNYEMYFLPDNAYAAGDPMNGVNGSLHYIGTSIAS